MKGIARLALMLLCFGQMAELRADGCPPKSRDEIKTMVTNLGYTVAEQGNLLTINISDKYNYPIYFSPMPDKTNLAVFTVLETVPADKLGQIPAAKILQFNDTHLNYFSLNDPGTGKLRFVLQNVIPTATATPQTLRTAVSTIVGDANQTDELWSPGKWK